jgi:hypothetical protein
VARMLLCSSPAIPDHDGILRKPLGAVAQTCEVPECLIDLNLSSVDSRPPISDGWVFVDQVRN